MISSITDLILENTSIIIVVAVVLVCIIIGYIGDKRFKAKGILEKKEKTLEKEETIVESEPVKEEPSVEIITTNENEIPVFDNVNDITNNNLVNNSDAMYTDNMNQNINNQSNTMPLQTDMSEPNIMYSDNFVEQQVVSNEQIVQQPVNNMPLSQMANQANSSMHNPLNANMQEPISSNVQNTAQEFPYSPEDNINNIF